MTDFSFLKIKEATVQCIGIHHHIFNRNKPTHIIYSIGIRTRLLLLNIILNKNNWDLITIECIICVKVLLLYIRSSISDDHKHCNNIDVFLLCTFADIGIMFVVT